MKLTEPPSEFSRRFPANLMFYGGLLLLLPGLFMLSPLTQNSASEIAFGALLLASVPLGYLSLIFGERMSERRSDVRWEWCHSVVFTTWFLLTFAAGWFAGVNF